MAIQLNLVGAKAHVPCDGRSGFYVVPGPVGDPRTAWNGRNHLLCARRVSVCRMYAQTDPTQGTDVHSGISCLRAGIGMKHRTGFQ